MCWCSVPQQVTFFHLCTRQRSLPRKTYDCQRYLGTVYFPRGRLISLESVGNAWSRKTKHTNDSQDRCYYFQNFASNDENIRKVEELVSQSQETAFSMLSGNEKNVHRRQCNVTTTLITEIIITEREQLLCIEIRRTCVRWSYFQDKGTLHPITWDRPLLLMNLANQYLLRETGKLKVY